jgi:hypothetical protein
MNSIGFIMNSISFIMKFIIDNHSFERLNEHQEDSKFAEYSYEEFVKFNKKCIEELSKKDLEFLEMLCKNFLNESIKMVDEESFIEWPATNIYFNEDEQLVITHPR